MAESDVGKLFVGGITRDTSDVTLKQHFSKYGNVSYSIIAKDRITNLPRGFGFVSFTDSSSADLALLDHHLINGRTVEVKRAIPRSEQQHSIQKQQEQQQQQSPSLIHSQTNRVLVRNSNGTNGACINNQHTKSKKIFVGGLSANLTEEEFRSYFEKFGRITDVVVMHDNNTNRPRGFGFITFDSEEVVEKIVQKSHHELSGKRVEVKRAIPREATKSSYNGNTSRFGGERFSPAAGQPAEESYWLRSLACGTFQGQYAVSTSYPGYYYGGSGVYAGAYPFAGSYGVFGYGMPLVPPRGPWNSVSVAANRTVNYGTGYYPSGLNGGFPMLGMLNPYGSVFEPGANRQVIIKDATPPAHGTRPDGDASSLKMSKGDVSIKKNSRAIDSEAKVSAAGDSS